MHELMQESRITALYRHPEHSLAWPLLCKFNYPWESLGAIKSYILLLGATLPEEDYVRVGEDVWINRSAAVDERVGIHGPCIIGGGSELRQGAFLRGGVLVGEGCVVGNSTELKNCILFDGVQVPHFNYVGDSILGYRAHMGAGAITSNVKSDKSLVVLRYGGEALETGRKKVGAMLGDFVEIGCNSVLNPGTVIGSGTTVYPLSSVRGYVPRESVYKSAEQVLPRERRDART